MAGTGILSLAQTGLPQHGDMNGGRNWGFVLPFKNQMVGNATKKRTRKKRDLSYALSINEEVSSALPCSSMASLGMFPRTWGYCSQLSQSCTCSFDQTGIGAGIILDSYIQTTQNQGGVDSQEEKRV